MLKGSSMPRYFFNVRNDHYIRDSQGTELEGDEEAKREALKSSLEILRGTELAYLWDDKVWSMDVMDQDGRTVATLTFSGMVAQTVA